MEINPTTYITYIKERQMCGNSLDPDQEIRPVIKLISLIKDKQFLTIIFC